MESMMLHCASPNCLSCPDGHGEAHRRARKHDGKSPISAITTTTVAQLGFLLRYFHSASLKSPNPISPESHYKRNSLFRSLEIPSVFIGFLFEMNGMRTHLLAFQP